MIVFAGLQIFSTINGVRVSDQFFSEQSKQSKVKAGIVFEYFKQWSKIMASNVDAWGAYHGTDKIMYLDVYSGPGVYEDGEYSTPLLIIEYALERPELQDKLLCFFNDADKSSISKLEEIVMRLPGIEKLKNKPEFFHGEVDGDMAAVLKEWSKPPTLLFADPFGYKGLTLELIDSVLQDFGGEIIFFFNYNRTQAAIKNPSVAGHMDALFGKKRADKLREIENGSGNKEGAILDALFDALTEKYGKYFCLFRFPSLKKDTTSHYLIYVTKHKLGYEIMHSTMAKASDSTDLYGVHSFQYRPGGFSNSSVFNPLVDLGLNLHKKFKGQKLTLDEFWVDESIGTPFIRKNFVEAIHMLADKGMVSWLGQTPIKRNHCGAKTIIYFE